MEDPLVSCVMPTRNRRAFVPAAIDCWLQQTYTNRELIIVDDGEDEVRDLVPIGTAIRYIRERVPSRFSTGSKRNFCNDLAAGELICHFDDDDFSAPDRIEFQVRKLEESGLPCTGFSMLYFWDVRKLHARRYRGSGNYVCGTSLMYLKSFWEQRRFPNKQVASDNGFIYPALKQIAASPDSSHMVARIHGNHTSCKDGIRDIIDKNLLPSSFWTNERLRTGNDSLPCDNL